jgi:hypothetical protein
MPFRREYPIVTLNDGRQDFRFVTLKTQGLKSLDEQKIFASPAIGTSARLNP